MNPLAELKERLVYISVAGIQLLAEDFRLKKAVEAFSLLADKNPVFKKIYTDLQALMCAEQGQQGVLLLNLLGLIDAVLYTQATFGTEGELKEFSAQITLGKQTQIRYSALAPLLQALSTTGSGRMEILKNSIINNPDYFQDYRIIHALINDLSDSYGEMASLVYQVLASLGTGSSILFLDYENGYIQKSYQLPQINMQQLIAQLKQDFDPKGKQAMVRRVALISEIAKDQENDWYLSLLDTANKEIRNQAILSLSHSQQNIPLLTELLKKEKGKGKDAVYKALSGFTSPEMISFWKKTLKETPRLGNHFLFTDSEEIADVIAENFKNESADLADKNLPYKPSVKVFEVYRWYLENASQNESLGNYLQNHLKEVLILSCPDSVVSGYEEMTHSPKLKNLTPKDFDKVISFLDSLTLAQQQKLGSVCFVADCITLSAEKLYEKWSHGDSLVEKWFRNISYIDNRYYYWIWSYLKEDRLVQISCSFKEPLDSRWFSVFMDKQWDFLLYNLIPTQSSMKHKIGEYFYQKLINNKGRNFSSTNISNYLEMMKKCGCETFEGVLAVQCRNVLRTSEYTWVPIFEKYKECTNQEATYQEARRVVDVYRNRFQNGKLAQDVQNILTKHGYFKEEG